MATSDHFFVSFTYVFKNVFKGDTAERYRRLALDLRLRLSERRDRFLDLDLLI